MYGNQTPLKIIILVIKQNKMKYTENSQNKNSYTRINYSKEKPQLFVPNKLKKADSFSITTNTNNSKDLSSRQIPLTSNVISQNAINQIGMLVHKVSNLNMYDVESEIKKCYKSIYQLMNFDPINQLKNIQYLQLLLYKIIFMYVEQASRSKQSNSIVNQRSRSNNRQKNSQLKSEKYIGLNQIDQKVQTQFNTKINFVKFSLGDIIQKAEEKSNRYELKRQDVQKLKQSFVQLSKIKPSMHYINTNSLSHTPPIKNIHKKSQSDDGNQILIQQLQQIVLKKQNRIKELTKQLQQNLQDQRELQSIIQKMEEQKLLYEDQIQDLNETLQKLKNQKELQIFSKKQQTNQQMRANQITEKIKLKQIDKKQRPKSTKNSIIKTVEEKIYGTYIQDDTEQEDGIWIDSNKNQISQISSISPGKKSNVKQDNQILLQPAVTVKKDKHFSKFQLFQKSDNDLQTSRKTIQKDLSELQSKKSDLQRILLMQALTIQQFM